MLGATPSDDARGGVKQGFKLRSQNSSVNRGSKHDSRSGGDNVVMGYQNSSDETLRAESSSN